MADNKKCPDRLKIIDYFFGELNSEEIREMDEHFFECGECAKLAKLGLTEYVKVLALKARPVLGEAWNTKNMDITHVKAAASGKKVHIIETEDKKYRITLRPSLDNEKIALLKVEVLAKSQGGILRVFNMEGFDETVTPGNDGTARFIVDSGFDINGLFFEYNPI